MTLKKNENETVIKSYSFANLSDKKVERSNDHRDLWHKELSSTEKSNFKTVNSHLFEQRHSSFKLEESVQDSRGLSSLIKNDEDKKVSQLVQVKMDKLREAAYKEGFQIGKEDGSKLAYEAGQKIANEKMDEVVELLSDLKSQTENLLLDHKKQILDMTKSISKWLMHKESAVEGYLPQLLEKLIYEISDRHNLIIKFDQNSFERHQQIIETVQSKVGEMKNLRIEIDRDMHMTGVSVESNHSILESGLETQFELIDRVFLNLENSNKDKDGQ